MANRTLIPGTHWVRGPGFEIMVPEQWRRVPSSVLGKDGEDRADFAVQDADDLSRLLKPHIISKRCVGGRRLIDEAKKVAARFDFSSEVGLHVTLERLGRGIPCVEQSTDWMWEVEETDSGTDGYMQVAVILPEDTEYRVFSFSFPSHES